MLVLSRNIGDAIIIGDATSPEAIAVIVAGVRDDGNKVRIGIKAPQHVPVNRPKVVREILARSGQQPASHVREFVEKRIHTDGINAAYERNADANSELAEAGEYWHATRLADAEPCIVWRFQDTAGRLKVRCCRTPHAMVVDFQFHSPVAMEATA
jgi:carbon storage regulator